MPILILVFFIALAGVVSAQYVPAREAQMLQARADVAATNALAYRESVINFTNANPYFTGIVPNASLTYLWGHTRDSRWTNVVAYGTLYVYESIPSNNVNLLDVLYAKTQKSFMVGINQSGQLKSAKAFTNALGVVTLPGITIHPSVPNNAIVMVGK